MSAVTEGAVGVAIEPDGFAVAVAVAVVGAGLDEGFVDDTEVDPSPEFPLGDIPRLLFSTGL